MKKLIAVFLSLCFCLCLFAPVCFADNSVASDHTHNWVKQKIHSYSLEYNGIAFGIDVYKCSDCVLYLHKMLFLGYEVPIVRASPDTALGSEAAAMCAQALIAVFGKEWYATKFEAGGGSASPGGVGRNPAGYAGEGTPSYNVDGDLFVLAQPIFYARGDNDKTPIQSGRQNDKYGYYSIDFDNPFISFRNLDDDDTTATFGYTDTQYYFQWCYTCPVDGIYFTTETIEGIDNSTCKISTFSSHRSAGSKVYVSYDNSYYGFKCKLSPYQTKTLKLNTFAVKCVPDKAPITKNTNITINNNTWNGNIYVDNSTNLTYIYPQYTTINENNETVTNISNNPIIYNQETKQYYTYDQTTNNYYYITYGGPAPTPTPSPSPDPGGSTPDPGKPTPTPTPGGSGGGSGDSPSGGGSNWWDKLLDDILSGLLEGVKGILKLLLNLFSSILGWIIWLCSKVFDLFPFLPRGVGALLVGGVVVCFILAFIKFIRG